MTEVCVKYSQSLAWLGATPEQQTKSRLEAIKYRNEHPEEGATVEAQTEIHLPPIPAALENLLSFFYESGQVAQTGMGLVGLSYGQIEDYIKATGVEMMVWEKLILKQMSDAYAAEYSSASDPKRPAPYTPYKEEESDEDKLAAAIRMRENMRAFRKRK